MSLPPIGIDLQVIWLFIFHPLPHSGTAPPSSLTPLTSIFSSSLLRLIQMNHVLDIGAGNIRWEVMRLEHLERLRGALGSLLSHQK